MKYIFKCPKCQKKRTYEMSVSEYEVFEAKCEECGEDLVRIYEVPKVKGRSGGEEGNSSLSSSCPAGSCSTCSLCG